MVLPIGVLLFAGLLLYAGLNDIPVSDVLRKGMGRPTSGGKLGALTGGPTVVASPSQIPGSTAGTPTGITGQDPNAKITNTKLGNTTNPIPGASGSRLDQGFDGTSKTFLSPFDGKVVFSEQSDSGWKGGGYVAVQSTADPSKVFYAAEGIAPVVRVGDHVRAGQRIGTPVLNPYNGIVGNFEIGWANPAAPGQPLAQATSDPVGMVKGFYAWLRSLGGPAATSTGDAGHA